ncbi:hypothetical protein GCM10023219_18610 [Stakelama sediminis]|uniref:Sacsin/Nov domain-containing protein n=1 Tax=Stakelama sediminis TaxID=463200 RepID=A0A840Z245_9SPHN|nr:hypothetical protein [Stakelama sediminis]MBB5719869.1 hypothetical protein [Stakelama sediminis]
MSTTFLDWLGALRARRERWVNANHENNFDRGIWNATVEKYADPSHFIFELLQNAEDAGASWVRFTLESDRIVFEHDGRPFDRDDIEGITGIGNTTKLDDGHKIGCFGIGFKSVYVVTERPEVHSRIEGAALAFAIEDLVVPKLIDTAHGDDTTQIVLPLRADRADLAVTRARDGLASSGAAALLFLERVKRLEWVDGDARGRAEVSDGDGAIRSIRSRLPDGTDRRDRYLIVSRPVESREDRKQYEVKAALRLNDGGDLVPEDAPTRLRVFFETQENTGLHFIVHGPFQLTDNRANIKLDDDWNAELIEAIGDMVADTLPGLRDRGMLKRGVLDLLPNSMDELPPVFVPILTAIAERFQTEALIPASEGGFVTAPAAIRGPAELRDLLGDDGLNRFAGLADRRWITPGLRNSRSENLVSTLKIEDWDHGKFFAAFQRAFGQQTMLYQSEADARKLAVGWFDGLEDEAAQRFYLALDAALKAQKRSVSISGLKFIRLESGGRHSPTFAVLSPTDSELDPEAEQCDLFLVKKSLVRLGRGRGKDVEQFLRRIGVKDVDEKAYLAAIIRTQYKGDGARPNRERHLQHMRRFIRWWKEHGDIAMFAGVEFIRAGSDAAYHDADAVYFGEPFLKSALNKVYDGSIEGRERAALWEGYAKLPRKDLLAFLTACGVEDSLSVMYSGIPYEHPHWSELHSGFGATRNTGSGINIDYQIDELTELLARDDAEVSRLVWDAVSAVGAKAMTASYSPNQSRAANQRPSSLALVLRDTAWIPTKDGGLRIPRTITAGDLAKGFNVGGNEAWLQAIGLGEEHRQRSEQHKARRKAGELIGLDPALVDQLSGLPPEALAELNADVLRKIASRSYERVAFPERESGSPGRRAERLAARARSAPSKTYEVRERSVRVSSGESKALARTYLEDHYTNPLGDMICQGCHEKMPFNLPDGSPYFEACELVESLPTEQAENHLAMCPTCAAKWRYANPVSDGDLRAALSLAISPEIDITLAGESVRVRFTQVHLDDIRTVSGISKVSSSHTPG